jgi:hypothetical protein
VDDLDPEVTKAIAESTAHMSQLRARLAAADKLADAVEDYLPGACPAEYHRGTWSCAVWGALAAYRAAGKSQP